jgi:hypothetical protein
MVKVPRNRLDSPGGWRVEVQLYTILTSALEGVGGQHNAPAALPPGKTRYPSYRRLGGPHGRYWHVQKISPLKGFDPRTVQPVASLYTDWATHIYWILVNMWHSCFNVKRFLLYFIHSVVGGGDNFVCYRKYAQKIIYWPNFVLVVCFRCSKNRLLTFDWNCFSGSCYFIITFKPNLLCRYYPVL